LKVSLIATTYNQPVDLDLYLRTVEAQTRRDFQVVIADDGSGDETRAVVERHRARLGDRLVHVWHEDVGYRKTKILNSAIRKSSGELLVFTDSDLVLHPRFIEDHVSASRPRGMFMGRRVDLSPAMSDWARGNPARLFTLEFYYRLVKDGLAVGGTRNVNRGFRVASEPLSNLLGMDRVPDLLGSNFSIDRKLLEELNGFNEALEHYWGEDGDLFVRARNAGAAISGRKSFAVQFHLFHPFRKPKPDAEAWYRGLLEKRDYVRCEKGLA
jgi:glycosyltransferase involved in cell wall biosynthesis